jgi:hypothetical protein
MNALEQSTQLSQQLSDPTVLFPEFTIEKDVRITTPYITYVFKFLPRFLMYSSLYRMTDRWQYRPDYVSYDMYETTNLWWLILYVNRVPSAIEFTMSRCPNVVVPFKNVVENFMRETLLRR